MTRTLLLIFAFLALMIGTFIWFVATWDADAEEPVSITDPAAPVFILAIQLPPEAPAPTTSLTWVVTHLTPPKGLPA